MAISLQKGQSIILKEKDNKLKNIKVCLGWDPKKDKGGFLSSLLTDFLHGLVDRDESEFDLDASAFLVSNKKVREIIYFAHLYNASKTVVHGGDNLTGRGKILDKEQIKVDLQNLPTDIDSIYFAVNIYQARFRKQNFGMIDNAFIRIVNIETEEEFCRYDLSAKNYAENEAMLFGALKRDHKNNDEWNFEACGEGIMHGSAINEIKPMIEKIINK